MYTIQRKPSASQRESARPVFLTAESAWFLLEEQGYRPVFRFHHVHAVHTTATFTDERHLCVLDDLARLTAGEFLHLVAEAFRLPGYTRPVFGLPTLPSIECVVSRQKER
jgi:hypothetical protein